MREAGFEPAHPEIVGLKSTALDHSAIRAKWRFVTFLLLLSHSSEKQQKLHLHYIAFTHSKNSKNKRMSVCKKQFECDACWS